MYGLQHYFSPWWANIHMIHRPDSTLQVLKLYILYRYVYNIYIYDIIWSIMHLTHLTWLYQWHIYPGHVNTSNCHIKSPLLASQQWAILLFLHWFRDGSFLDQVTSFSRMSGLIAILMPTSFLGKAVGPAGPVGPGVEMNSEGQGSPISPKVLGINDDALWRGSGGF